MTLDLTRWQALVAEEGADGWLLADFRRNNPILIRLLALEAGTLSRRCFLWLPAPGKGQSVVLASRVDGHTFAHLDCQVELYAGFEDMCAALAGMFPAGARIAMEYSDNGILPTISRVDAGLVDLIRGRGVTVLSSGGLIARAEQWNKEQRELHRRAARGVDEARRAALARCREVLARGETLSEGALSSYIAEVLASDGLAAGGSPEVAVGPHAADPHYSIGEDGGATIERNAVLLIDFTAKVPDREGAPFADTTWMTYTGANPPEELLRICSTVREAQGVAIARINEASRARRPITGYDVDVDTRQVIADAGLGEYLVHRTGHSLGTDHVHGMGTNLDSVEFPDRRQLLVWSGFTVEPGVYLPGRFGVRLEVSTFLTPDGLEITTDQQKALTLLS